MNQQTFMRQLEVALVGLPAAERQEILADYAEYFRDALADGRSEEEVAASLGDPQRLAREFQAKVKLQAWESRRSVGNLFGVVGAMAGLGVLNFVLAIPFMIYLGFLTLGFVVSCSLLFGGVLLTGLWASNSLFGWPAIEPVLFHHGSGVAWVASTSESAPPLVNIQGGQGDRVVIHRDTATGATRIEASGADGAVRLERSADGSISRLQLSGDDGVVELQGLGGLPDLPNRSILLVTGLALLLAGGVGLAIAVVLVRATWHGLARFGRYQLSLLSGEREEAVRA